MSTLEERKLAGAQQYALDNMNDVSHLTKLRNAWLDGFETAYPKWNNVEELLPEAWCQHKNEWESDEVLIDCGDFYKVSRYCKKYDESYQKLVWEGFDAVEDTEIVTKWTEIPQ